MLHRDVASAGLLPQSQFDFWLGTWELRWTTPEGHPRAGSNVITKALGDAVILESFTDLVGADGRGYEGMSVSTYDATAGVWQQTWVDSDGSHMSFSGGAVEDRMELYRQVVLNGSPVVQRMSWHSIDEASFVWDWERSPDQGRTWEMVWRIDYRRVA